MEIRAEVNLGAIRQNLQALRALLAPAVKVLGVVKADGYGHGAAAVARTLQQAGVDMLGVALVEEGVELRTAGITVPVLVMGVAAADEVAAAIAHDLALTVNDREIATAIDREARKQGKTVPVHLKVDTGMNRLGVRAEEALRVAEALRPLKHLALEGVYTHFACAESKDPEVTGAQLARFEEILRSLAKKGLRPPIAHAANTAALVTRPESHFEMVRPGLGLYGVLACEAPAGLSLRPALALRSAVVHLKRVRRGEGVGYGHTWRAERDGVLGLLPIGYGDGYPRALSNRGQVRIGTGKAGRLCPLVGTISMDATMVDLTDVPGARVGLEAALIETDGASPMSVSRVAEAAGTIPYEILAGLTKRVPRVYV